MEIDRRPLLGVPFASKEDSVAAEESDEGTLQDSQHDEDIVNTV